MSQWLLLVNADETEAQAIQVLPNLAQNGEPAAFDRGLSSEKPVFSIRLYDEDGGLMKDKSLYACAKKGGKFGYQLLWDEEALQNKVGDPHFEGSAYFQLQSPNINVTGRSGELLFALAVITAALPRAGGYPHYAATGELDEPAGSVYPVNGIKTKVQKAIETLIELPGEKFIFYPIGNDNVVDEHLKTEAKEKYNIELCPLTWFDQALEKLGVPLELYIGNPFMGLQSVTRNQRAVYFGRREEAKQLAQKLVGLENESQAPAIAILAASGWGKSSFIQAGLLPELEEQLRLTDRPLLSCLWRLEKIRNTVAKQTIDEPHLLAALREYWLPETWATEFTEAHQHAIRQANDFPALAQAIANALPSSRRFLWVIDQAEELFTFGFTPEAIQGFVGFLSALRDSGVWLLLALRNDFFQDYHKYYGDLFDDHKLWSLRTTLDSIIQEPVKRARRPPIQFESFEDKTTLANLLSKDMPHSPEDALPLLQFALYRLWEMAETRRRAAILADESIGDGQDPESEKRRKQRKTPFVLTLEDYEVLAGHQQAADPNVPDKNRLEGVIGKHADDIYQNQEPSVQAALPQLLWDLSIARPDPEGGYRFYAQSATLANYPKDSAEAKLIAAFAHKDARLLVLDEGKVRVIHEALLRYWGKAREELKLLGEDMAVRERVRHEYEIWSTKGKTDDLLLMPVMRLAEGKILLARRQWMTNNRLDNGLIKYIEASIVFANKKQRSKQFVIASIILSLMAFSAGLYSKNMQISSFATRLNEAFLESSNILVSISEILKKPDHSPVSKNESESILASYDKLLKEATKLAQEMPDKLDYQKALGLVQMNYASMIFIASPYDYKAKNGYVAAIEIFKALAENNPDKQEYAELLENAYDRFAYYLQKAPNGSMLGSYDYYKRALTVRLNMDSNSSNYSGQLAKRYGQLAWAALLIQKFEDAKENAEQGIKADSGKTWIQINLAHALLYLGKTEEAFALYGSHMKNCDDLLKDFKEMREAGLNPSPMEMVLHKLPELGCVIQPLNSEEPSF